MFKTFFKTSIRNIWKSKGFSLLNVSGLAIGITCAAFIFLWVEDELHYNDYFPQKENIYEVMNHQQYDGENFVFESTPGPLAAGIQSEIPGIQSTARTSWHTEMPFNLGDKSLSEQGLYVDSSFFNIFSLKFIEGNSASAFNDPKSVVLTKEMAEKFFGKSAALGRQINMGNNEPFVVTGVVDNLPENVSVSFQWLAPFINHERANEWLQNWGSNGILTYVQTVPHANIDAINKQLHSYLQSKNNEIRAKLSLNPMNRWRLYTYNDGRQVEGRMKFVKLFSLIAWIILVIACINFMNLSTARSEKRAREVGVRKVLGAHKKGLVYQFIAESLMMAFISAVIAIALVYLLLPLFNNLVQKHLTLGLSKPDHWLALILITVVCGLVAGSYPAFYLSSFNPVKVLKGLRVKQEGSVNFIRKGLVITQFTISIILIICTILIYQQITYVQNRDMGYNKENLVTIPLRGTMKQNYGAIKNELIANGAISNAGLSNSGVLNFGSNTGDFSWKGKDPGKIVLITVEGISPDFVPTVGYHLSAGRNFYPDAKMDSNNIIINEALASVINDPHIVGSNIMREDAMYTVVGVVKNFVYGDMYAPAAPMIFFSDTSNTNYLTVRLTSSMSTKDALAKVEHVIKSINPNLPFEYKFVDSQFAEKFKMENLIGKLASVFAILAVIISCLGLFGLAAYTAERRTREIGIRKVLGASVQGLTALLTKDFVLLVGISCLIAFPIAWWMMKNFLQQFAYRIDISWIVFAFAGLISMIIAIATVSFQAIRTALMNPVTSIKSE